MSRDGKDLHIVKHIQNRKKRKKKKFKDFLCDKLIKTWNLLVSGFASP